MQRIHQTTLDITKEDIAGDIAKDIVNAIEID